MHVQVADDGSIEFCFSATEADMAIAMLTTIEPKDENGERAIQGSIDLILEHNNCHQYRTIN